MKFRKAVMLALILVLPQLSWSGGSGVTRDVEFVEDYGCVHWEDPGSELEAGIEICTDISVLTNSQYMQSGIIKRTVYLFYVETMTYS